MIASIKSWVRLLQCTQQHTPNIILKVPILALHHLIAQVSLTSWTRKGITHLHNLNDSGTLKSFPSIQKEFHLPQKDLYKYLQIKHCLRNLINTSQTILTPAWAFLTSSIPLKKGITLFYNIFQQKTTFIKSTPHLQWETDLQQTFSPLQWQRACKVTQRATRCSTLWEITVKITLRWYITPAKISKFNPNSNDRCWRKCGLRGDILHVLWYCPNILQYWLEIFNIISDITQTKTPPNPALAILSIGIEEYPPELQNTIINILLAARLTITRHWKDHTSPIIAEVIDLTNLHCTYEQMMMSCSGQIQTSDTQWSPWTTWYLNTGLLPLRWTFLLTLLVTLNMLISLLDTDSSQ